MDENLEDPTDELPGARTATWRDVGLLFVDTPMDNHTRTECQTRVRGWSDHDYGLVSLEVDIGGAEPLELSCNIDAARQLGSALLTAAADAERLVDGEQ